MIPRDPMARLPADQSERALIVVWLAMAAGLGAIGLLALGQPGLAAGVRLLTIAGFAALAAAAGGTLIGLLFGMPASAGRIRIVPPGPTAGAATTTASDEPATSPGGWYRDNTALERLSEWLTTAIVTLLIANFRAISQFIGGVSTAVTEAMALWPAPDVRAGGVAGGLVLGAYGLLGFLGGYVWSRRYLSKIFSDAAADARQVQIRSDDDTRSRVGAGGIQSDPKGPDAAAKAAAAVEAVAQLPVRTAVSSRSETSFPPPVAPGPVADDPWNGQFGRLASDGRAEISATAAPLRASPSLFNVELVVSASTPANRSRLAGHPVRLYLHPSFPDPIRLEHFDESGKVRVSLIAFGAFTIGVQFEDDERLELDLSKLPDAPAAFRLG